MSDNQLEPCPDDHEFSLSDDFSDDPLRITQTRYFKAGNIVVAIAELNRPNQWNDAAFDAACEHLQSAWNTRSKQTEPVGLERLTEILSERRLPGTRNGPITEPRDLAEHILASLKRSG